jgi:hypothetical protein
VEASAHGGQHGLLSRGRSNGCDCGAGLWRDLLLAIWKMKRNTKKQKKKKNDIIR